MLKREIFHSKRNYQNPNSIPLNDDTILGIFFIEADNQKIISEIWMRYVYNSFLSVHLAKASVN